VALAYGEKAFAAEFDVGFIIEVLNSLKFNHKLMH